MAGFRRDGHILYKSWFDLTNVWAKVNGYNTNFLMFNILFYLMLTCVKYISVLNSCSGYITYACNNVHIK